MDNRQHEPKQVWEFSIGRFLLTYQKKSIGTRCLGCGVAILLWWMVYSGIRFTAGAYAPLTGKDIGPAILLAAIFLAVYSTWDAIRQVRCWRGYRVELYQNHLLISGEPLGKKAPGDRQLETTVQLPLTAAVYRCRGKDLLIFGHIRQVCHYADGGESFVVKEGETSITIHDVLRGKKSLVDVLPSVESKEKHFPCPLSKGKCQKSLQQRQ